jgi:exodeoxyribonuclease VII large subunit
MRGRHASELTHQLRRAMASRLARAQQRHRALHAGLEARDVRRRLGAIRTQLATVDGRLATAVTRRRDRADARFRVLVGRLENLSPLGVLARGYAVCWNGDRTAIVRSVGEVEAGDRVRVTLHDGELACDVTDTKGAAPDPTT